MQHNGSARAATELDVCTVDQVQQASVRQGTTQITRT
jgi:hypothetical protein